MLKTENLHFAYNSQQTFQFPNLSCEAGQELLILGQSGCGKTTLLHLLGGLLRPSSGSIALGDVQYQNLSATELDHVRGQRIGIVFQQSHLLKALTVEENLLTAQYLAQKPQDRQAIAELLQTLNLGHKLHERPASLSLGEQQRVAIARALINRPQLILADEPTSSLDDVNCREVIELLRAQSQRYQAALVIVTHDARLKNVIANQITLVPQQQPVV